MGALTDRLETDYKTAFKAQERLKIDTLRLIKAAIQRVAMDKRKDALDDAEVLAVLSQQAKQRHETLTMAKQSNRQDVVQQAEAELTIIGAYLPKPLSEAELRALVDEAIQSVGPNQGPIMKFVMGKAGGAADGKLVSRLVGERLNAK